MNIVNIDAVLLGGGVSGLWTLNHLLERGYCVLLLESNRLGQGQTVAAQGIIHGGLKYALQGVFTSSAEGIREMPSLWRQCLEGKRSPDLTSTTVRAQYCHLWRTRSLRSLMGEIGARLSLRVKPVKLDRNDWPKALAEVSGDVLRLDEQVIDPVSLVDCLTHPYREKILQIDCKSGLEWQLDGPGIVRSLRIRRPDSEHWVELRAKSVVLTAGEGNAALRESVGLSQAAMQRRPLHMVMVRGDLPTLNGHCIDAAMTPRMTITSAPDTNGRTVWQLGGRVADKGVQWDKETMIRAARKELMEVLPGLRCAGLEWATYRIDRAEAATPDRSRPNDAQVQCDANVVTAWPTKLALAPKLAERVAHCLGPPSGKDAADLSIFRDWPSPKTALPPWKVEQTWIPDGSEAQTFS